MLRFYLLSFLFLSGSGLKAQDWLECHFNVGFGGSLFSVDRIETFFDAPIPMDLVQANRQLGFAVRTGSLQTTITAQRLFFAEPEGFEFNLGQVVLTLGPVLKLSDRWTWVPSVGWYVTAGTVGRFIRLATPQGAFIRNIRQSAFVLEHAAVWDNEFNWKLPSDKFYLPDELVLRLGLALPVYGPSLLELPADQLNWEGTRISSWYLNANLSVRYKLFSL